MLGLVHLTTWGRRVLPAACVVAALVVAGERAVSHASNAPVSVAPPPKPSVPAQPAAPVGPSRVALEPLDVRPTPNPLRGLSPAALDRLALTKPASLGSVCVGRPNRGQLWNSVELASEPGLRVMVQRDTSFGTAATVQAIHAAVSDFRAVHPDAPDLTVGDLSHERGGYLRPHHSHQLGLDADLGYFYRANGKWYTKATAENLDRELTWSFLKALIAQGTIEYVFMDRSVQALLRAYASERGEDPAWLDTLFESPARRDTLIRHAYGHITHFHVRFLDPAAERTGRLLEARLAPHRRHPVAHAARR
jgi:penicillin-insensitive murein endopeptidase